MNDLLVSLQAKKEKVAKFGPLPKVLADNLKDWFKIELTYTSNAIEGNTLSRQETALVIEKGLTVQGKSLREHLEAVNHYQALIFIAQLAGKKKDQICEADILKIHQLILNRIDDENAGCWRRVNVRIAGSRVVLPNSVKIPQLMEEFISWLHQTKENLVKIAADCHFKFVSIHPFTDGNGRTARLLMNLILMQAGYPPAIIRKEERLKYINSIEKGQLFGNLDDYYQLIYKAVGRSLDIYLEARQNKEIRQKLAKKLFRIGELAKLTGETISAIRYWTKEGLLEVADYTPGGYQLYNREMASRVEKIRLWQKNKRLAINEIKARKHLL